MPTQVEPQPQADPRTATVTADPGSEDEAIAAFNQRRQSQAQTESDPPTDEPPEDDDSPEADADPGTEAEAEDLVEVEYEGEKYELPPKLQKALLRQADYSRNMSALAESKKDYAQRVETAEKLIEGAKEIARLQAEAISLDAQLEQYKSVDWASLERDDPARASLYALKRMQLQQARDNILHQEQQVESRLADGRSKKLKAEQAEMLKVLAKDFPAWGDEAGARVTTYAKSVGYSDEEIGRIADARLVIALDKARKFDAIQAGKAAAQGKVRDAQPVAKPGTPRRADPVADVRARFQKSTSPEDAEALFHAMAGGKRR